jgi:lipopolysaccharide biosynthesis regulator YciM
VWASLWQWFVETGNLKLLLYAIIAFGLGLVIGVWKRHSRNESSKSIPNEGEAAFFKGVHYILSNDHDHAIEEFTKSVQVNSDTIETYMALGNLYRSKGDIDRAIRIRQNIILRPNIAEQMKLRALFDLGLDYRKGGFLNRALDTFLRVAQKDTGNVQTYIEIEKIYEESKDWENAYRTRKKISQLSGGDSRHILAHHLVEMGKVYQKEGNLGKADSYFTKAISTYKGCIDAYLHLGDLYFSKKEYKKAISTWKKVAQVAPQFTFLAYRRLEGAYSKMKDLKPVEEFLKECARSNSDAFTHVALARYLYNKNDIEGALRELASALEFDPYFLMARKFKGEILLSHGREKEALMDYRELIEHLDVPYLEFQCSQCGFQANELQWQCPQCRSWDTIGLIDSFGTQSASTPGSEGPLPRLTGGAEEE